MIRKRKCVFHAAGKDGLEIMVRMSAVSRCSAPKRGAVLDRLHGKHIVNKKELEPYYA